MEEVLKKASFKEGEELREEVKKGEVRLRRRSAKARIGIGRNSEKA